MEGHSGTPGPCQYRTGKILGRGTYAVVKEGVHIATGMTYACKVINKGLVTGKEYMVRNEIQNLQKMMGRHPSIMNIHDYFETPNSIYLCLELCTGGTLADFSRGRTHYYESDAAEIIRFLMEGVHILHASGVVHRDLKPDNILFLHHHAASDLRIADFGLSRIKKEDELSFMTHCGTLGYMAPEILKNTGYGESVDIWAMGVITYLILSGVDPFRNIDLDKQLSAIIKANYTFEPVEHWKHVSEPAKAFVRECLSVDPAERLTSSTALEHKWLCEDTSLKDSDDKPIDLLPQIRFALRRKGLRQEKVFSFASVKRATMPTGNAHLDKEYFVNLISRFERCISEAEKERMEEQRIMKVTNPTTLPNSQHLVSGE